MARRKNLKEKAHELFPWEDEKKKKKPERMDSIPPSTSIKAKVKSKPPIMGQEYLELYLMAKEKERLEKFGRTFGKIQLQTSRSWRDIRKALIKAERNLPSVVAEMERFEGEDKEDTKKKSPEVKMPKKMKKVDWNF